MRTSGSKWPQTWWPVAQTLRPRCIQDKKRIKRSRPRKIVRKKEKLRIHEKNRSQMTGKSATKRGVREEHEEQKRMRKEREEEKRLRQEHEEEKRGPG